MHASITLDNPSFLNTSCVQHQLTNLKRGLVWLSSHNDLTRSLLSSPFHGWENPSPERLRDLPKAAQLLKVGMRFAQRWLLLTRTLCGEILELLRLPGHVQPVFHLSTHLWTLSSWCHHGVISDRPPSECGPWAGPGIGAGSSWHELCTLGYVTKPFWVSVSSTRVYGT